MPFFQVNKKLLLIKIHYFLGIGGFAPFSPFLTTISKQRGYSAFIVGLIFMLQPIPGLLIKPIIGVITDKYKCRRSVFVASSIVILVFVGLLSLIPGTNSKEEINDMDVVKSPLFWMFFGMIALINADGMVRGVLEDTICMDLLGEEKHKYGKQRLWGSIGWSLLAILSGACVDWYSKNLEYKNYTPAFIISMICFLLDIYVVLKMEVMQNQNTEVLASDVKKVFTECRVLAFLLWVIFFGFFVSFIWNFVFWYLEELSIFYHPEKISWIKTIQGLALIIQCIGGEVPSFFLSSYVLKRMDHMNVFSLMFFTFTIIFFMYSIIRDPLWTLPVEILNGIVFALSYSAAISYAALVSPAGVEGTLQGVVGTALNAIGAPIGSFIGGYMFKNIGSINSFKVLCVMALITCITQICVNRLINRFTNNEDVKDKIYSIVKTTDNTEENAIS